MHIFSFLYQCELTLQVFYGVLLVNRFKLKFSRLLFFFAKVLSEYFNDILELLNNRNFFLHLFDFVVPFLQFNFGVVVLFHALLQSSNNFLIMISLVGNFIQIYSIFSLNFQFFFDLTEFFKVLCLFISQLFLQGSDFFLHVLELILKLLTLFTVQIFLILICRLQFIYLFMQNFHFFAQHHGLLSLCFFILSDLFDFNLVALILCLNRINFFEVLLIN